MILKKYKRASIVYPLPNEIIFKPIMSKIEIIIFSYFMKKENIYFEFGSGGSTNIASYYKLKTYSVESDFNWHEKLKKSGVIANYITINLNAKNNILSDILVKILIKKIGKNIFKHIKKNTMRI